MPLLMLMFATAAWQDERAQPAGPAQAVASVQPQRWSILVDPCASARTKDEIVVCGQREQQPRLPLPTERGIPDRPMPGNPDVSGAGAMAMTLAPCATRSEGCGTGINLFGAGTTLIRGVGKLIDPNSCCEEPGEGSDFFKLVGDAAGAVARPFRKKADKSGRVAIPLDDLKAPAEAVDEGGVRLPLP